MAFNGLLVIVGFLGIKFAKKSLATIEKQTKATEDAAKATQKTVEMQVEAQRAQLIVRMTYKENLRMWGKLYVGRSGQTVAGWLIDSWAENGRPRMHWLDRKENKLQKVFLNVETSAMQLAADSGIEPERAKFIRETIEQWEKEWLKEQGFDVPVTPPLDGDST